MGRNTGVIFSLVLGIAAIGVGTHEKLGSTAATAEASSEVKALPPETKDLVTKASLEKDHAVFSRAVKNARLERLLRSKGPYTVFVPVDSAFGALSQSTLEFLLRTENRQRLRKLLRHHIVLGKYDTALLRKMIQDSPKKEVTLVTLAKASLTGTLEEDAIVLQDPQGNRARIMDGDQYARNGVLHDIDALMQSSPLPGRPDVAPPVLAE